MDEIEDKKKFVIGLYGEMRLSMALHDLGWSVHRAYIDEGIDFVASRYWCPSCRKYSNQLIRHEKYNGKSAKCVTNLCEHCKKTELSIVSRYLQVKTSEGKPTDDSHVRQFSFHPKIRYDTGKEVLATARNSFQRNFGQILHFGEVDLSEAGFVPARMKRHKDKIKRYRKVAKKLQNVNCEPLHIAWIAVFDDRDEKHCHFYIFNTKDVQKFDNVRLDTYQITDNQKTTLTIRDDGAVLNKGKNYDYNIFNKRFYNDWRALELELK